MNDIFVLESPSQLWGDATLGRIETEPISTG